MARTKEKRAGRFEVSKTGDLYASFGQAVNRAQRYAERVLTAEGTVYIFPVGEKKAIARIERQGDGSVVTFVNGEV